MKTSNNYVKQLLYACLILMGMVSYSQSPNIQWTAISNSATVDAVDVQVNSDLSRNGSQLVWSQNGGQTTIEDIFIITAIKGEWDANTMQGNIEYDILSDGEQGTFKIMGDGQSITMVLELSNEQSEGSTYVFYINSFTIN
jgi:hypothetical protein